MKSLFKRVRRLAASPVPIKTNQKLDHEAGNLEDRPPASTEDKSTTVILDGADTPKRRFARSKNAQEDLVVLQVAYILKESPDLKVLILEIVKLNKKPEVRQSFHYSSA